MMMMVRPSFFTHQRDPKFGSDLSSPTELEEHLVVPVLERNLQGNDCVPLEVRADRADPIQRAEVLVLQTSPADHFLAERVCPAIALHRLIRVRAQKSHAHVARSAFFGIPLGVEFEASGRCRRRRAGDLANLICGVQDTGRTERLG